MPRKVAVEASLEAAKYLASAKAVEKSTAAMDHEMKQLDRAIDAVDRDLAELSVAAEVAKKAVDDLGDKAGTTGGKLKALDAAIAASKLKVRELGLEFAKTGEAIDGTKLAKERSLLGKLEKLRKELREELLPKEEPVPKIIGSLEGLLGGIPNIGGAPPALIAGGAALGLALAPPLAAGVSGAILGAAGGGGVVGGAILAARDPRVKAAWKHLAGDLMHELEPVTDAFAGPVTEAAGALKISFDKSGIASALAGSSDLVGPLVKGIGGFVEKIGPGISAAFQGAAPVFDMLSKKLPEFGDDLAQSLEAIAAVGPSAARGLGQVIDVTGELTKQAARAGAGLTAINNLLQVPGSGKLLEMIPIGGLGQVVGTAIEQLSPKVASLGERMTGAGSSAEDMAEGLKAVEGSAERASDALQHMNDVQLGAIDNSIAFEQSLDDMAESLKENGRSLDINGQKGRDNMSSIEEALQNARKARDDMAATGKIEEANAAYQRMVERIRAVLVQAGLTKQQIDALVKPYEFTITAHLVTKGSIPKYVSSSLSQPAQDAAHRAGGGDLMPGRPYIFGENGPELGFFGAQGRMLSNSDSRAWAGSAGAGDRTITVVVKDTSGRTLRKEMIDDALGRGQPSAVVAAAYP